MPFTQCEIYIFIQTLDLDLIIKIIRNQYQFQSIISKLYLTQHVMLKVRIYLFESKISFPLFHNILDNEVMA